MMLTYYFSSSQIQNPMVPPSQSRFNNSGHNPIIMKTDEFTFLSIIFMIMWVGTIAILYYYKMHYSLLHDYFLLIFNSIPIINGGFITPMSFYFLKSNLRHFYVQMFWEIAPMCLQKFNPGHNLLPKKPNAHINVSKTINVIVPSEDKGSTIANIGNDNEDDSDTDIDNWWKKSAPGHSHQKCCANHSVPLNTDSIANTGNEENSDTLLAQVTKNVVASNIGTYCEVHRVPYKKNCKSCKTYYKIQM